jgi:starch synthase
MGEPRYSPSYDNKIFQKYGVKTLEGKLKNKQLFLEAQGHPFNKKVPLLCITASLTDKNKIDVLESILPGMLEQPVQIVMLGIGSAKYQESLTKIAEKHPEKIIITEGSDEMRRKIYAASDMMIVPALTEESMEEAKNALAYGTIPIMPYAEFAEDYSPVDEKGNAFIMMEPSAWSLFYAFGRAMENYRFPYDWKNIQLEAMEKSEA